MARKLKLKHIIDSNDTRYEVESIIGQGAQGYVLKLKGGKHVAKLVRKAFANSTEKSSWIDFLRNEDLDKNLFGKPVAKIVQPRLGYVAEFASGMEDMKVLRSFGLSGGEFKKWFIDTGGLRRRVVVLRNLAKSLKYLHSKGLVYADLSMNNVFISELGRGDNVFLIDTDNITYKSSVFNSIYTPMYGAPEVVTFKQPNSIESDCYAFAVIAYETLTQSHPLIGDYVDTGDPELEEKALRGELPWVDHSEDKTNSRSTGFSSKTMMTDGLFELFRKTFEDGLNNPTKRPSMGKWCDELERLSNSLVKCSGKNCVDYYIYRGDGCPFCDSRPKQLVRLKFWRWDPEYARHKTMLPGNPEQNNLVDEVLFEVSGKRTLRTRHFLFGSKDSLPNNKLLQVQAIQNRGQTTTIEFVNLSEGSISISGVKKGGEVATKALLNTSERKCRKPKKVGDKSKAFIHLRPIENPQRVMTIEIDE